MSAPVPIGSVIAERYRVESVLGEGGMGVVVRATHLVLHQQVALKFLRREYLVNADAVDRFVREARAAAKVKSEHVVRVHDVAALEDGTPFIVMEYVEGCDLGTLIAERGVLPTREAVRYVLQACEALAETHAAGIVHGDLKPENLYVTGSEGAGRIKLLDFGISRIVEDRTATAMGTPAYMAPERFQLGKIDIRSEIWSLGAVLYEMLAGVPAFRADSADEMRRRVTSEAPAAIERDDVPAGVRDIVHRCLERDPAKRYADTIELARALEPFAPQETASQRLEPAAARIHQERERRHEPTIVLPGRSGRRRSVVAIAVLAAGAALALAFVLRANRSEANGVHANAAPAPSAFGAPAARPLASTESETTAAPIATMTLTANEEGSSADAAAPPRIARPRRPRPVEKARAQQTPAPAEPPAEGDRYGTRK